MRRISIPVSVAELVDKITILEIKAERISDADKLKSVNKELELLRDIWAASPCAQADIADMRARLKSVNEALWDIEDQIRLMEAQARFDEKFIALARAVYLTNDQRSALKFQINRALGSDIIEEKSYADYGRESC